MRCSGSEVTSVDHAPRLTLAPELAGFSGEEADAVMWDSLLSTPTVRVAGRQRRDSEGEMQRRPFHSRKGRLLDFLTLAGLR